MKICAGKKNRLSWMKVRVQVYAARCDWVAVGDEKGGKVKYGAGDEKRQGRMSCVETV